MPAWLNEHRHRPWPLPDSAWRLAMRWEDLLFLHWPVPVDTLRRRVPAGLELDLFAGQAWLGVVPFRMVNTHLRGLPPFPGTGTFPELNVRTYVRHGGKPGVWFFSLDAASRLAVATARRWFHLPYQHARMRANAEGDAVEFRSARRSGDAEFAARYQPVGELAPAAPGSLEHWLTERYCLYAADPRGRLWRGDIHHLPWPLQPAQAEVTRNTMTAPLGFSLPEEAPRCHFARGLDVVAWGLTPA